MNPRRFLRRLLGDILPIAVLVLVGTLGYMLLENWRFLDSLFFTVISLTTVGYEVNHPLSDAGKVYTILLILTGVGVALYCLSDMVELFMELNLGRRRMQHRIVKLANHQIVCGWGRTGQEACETFRQSKVPFVVIEADSARAQKAEDEGLLVVQGDASSDEVLLLAQIKKASGIVCALPDDAANTFIALSARGLNENILIVSRAANPGSEAKLKRAGAHMVISPYVICGRRMATAVTHPLVTEFLDVVMQDVAYDLRIEAVKLEPRCPLVGATLKDANIKATSGAMILAVKQGGKLLTNPSPDMVFLEGDDLIALGTEQQLKSLALLGCARNI